MEYFSIVGKLYPDRVSAWWKNKIERKCTQAAERKVYQEIARWFSLFARYSSKEKAEQLKETILKRYPNRPAMKQEFARIRIKV